MEGLTLTAGLLTGVAGSLHCVGACLGISSTVMLSGHASPPEAARSLLLVHVGRITVYVAAGAAAGSVGGLLLMLRLADAKTWLQWITVAAMAWTGLSVAGLLPVPRLPSHAGGAKSGASPLLVGIAWGLVPCGMVYLAMFSAALSGSPVAGAAYMAAFALGTLPALAATTWGVTRLADRHSRHFPTVRVGIGATILLLGLVALVPGAGILSAFCGRA